MEPAPRQEASSIVPPRDDAPLRRRTILLPIFLALVAVFASSMGSHWYMERRLARQRLIATNMLSSKAYALSAAINSRWALLEGLGAFQKATTSDAETNLEFPVFAAELHAAVRGIRYFALAPKGVIRHVYPVAGNREVIGRDLFHHPKTREDALRALKKRATTLSEPYELHQGVLSIVARKPLFAGGKFWGLATMVIDLPQVMSEAGLDRPDRFVLALRDRHGKVFYGSPTIFDQSPAIISLGLPEGTWELAGLPVGGWKAPIAIELFVFRGVTLLVALLFALVVFQAYNKQRRLRNSVRARTEALSESEQFNRQLFELSPIGLALCRMDGSMVDVNPAFANILGRTQAEIFRLSYWEITPEKYADQERRQLECLEKTGRYGPYEKEYIHKDGHLVAVRLHGRIIERREERFIWSSVEDITERKRAEEMLRKNEALLDETQHLAKVGGWEYDLEHRHLIWTEETYCIHDLSRDSYDPNDLDEDLRHYPAPGRAVIENAFNGAVHAGEPFDLELPFVTAKGRQLWVRVIGKPIIYDGKVVRVVGNLMDITERARLEIDLRERNELLTLFADHSPAAIAMFDREMKYKIVSRRWIEDYKLSDKQIIGRSHYELFPEINETWKEIHRRCLAGAIERSDDDCLVRTDGSVDWIRWEIRPWNTGTGEIGGIILFSENITERKLAEAASEREHRFSEALIDSLPGVVYLYDDTFKFLRWNKNFERVTGYSAEEVARMTPLDFFAKSHQELLKSRIQEVFDTGGSNVEADFLSKDGSSIPYFFTGIRTTIGDKVCLIGIGIDISARKQLEAELTEWNQNLEKRVTERTRQLQESRMALVNLVEDLNEKSAELVEANEQLKGMDQLKSMFIASMSHELRTPLNSVIGYSSVILNEWLGPVTAEQKQHLAIVLRAGKHLLSLINDVIDISKIEAGQVEVHVDEFDLFDVIVEACQQLEKDIRGKGLSFSVDNDHLRLRTDRRRLLQAILNILSNAMKYTIKGSVYLSARGDGSYAEVLVRDTGIGISEKDSASVFRPFVRIETQLRSTVPGTGLGLYLTEKLVKGVLGGSIYYTSRIGEGSTFTIRVPAEVGKKPGTEGKT